MRTSSFRSLMMKFSTLSLAFGLAACGAPESEQNPLPEVRISAVPSEELRLQETGQEEVSMVLLGATAWSVQENLAAANPVIIVIGVQPEPVERGVQAEYMARGIQAQYMARGKQQANLESTPLTQGERSDAVLVEGVEPEILVFGLRDTAGLDIECVGGGSELAVCTVR